MARTREPDYLGLLAAGWVMVFVLPIGGFVVACLLAERRTGHAVAMAFLSTLVGFGYAWLFLG